MEANNPTCKWSDQNVVLYSPKTNLWKVVGRKLILGLVGNKSPMSKMCALALADKQNFVEGFVWDGKCLN